MKTMNVIQKTNKHGTTTGYMKGKSLEVLHAK